MVTAEMRSADPVLRGDLNSRQQARGSWKQRTLRSQPEENLYAKDVLKPNYDFFLALKGSSATCPHNPEGCLHHFSLDGQGLCHSKTEKETASV